MTSRESVNSMPKSEPKKESRVFDKTNVTLLLAGIAAIGAAVLVVKATPGSVSRSANDTSGGATVVAGNPSGGQSSNKVWAASAPGRVEPKGGAVRIRAEASGRVLQVYAAAGDKVSKGNLLVQLRDDEAVERLIQARAEVAVRLGERDEEPENDKAVIARRQAADELGQAQRAVHKAWMALDKSYLDRRAGNADDNSVAVAYQAIETAVSQVKAKSDALAEISGQKDAPLPTRLDSGLTLSRADLRLGEIAYENTRVRAPVDGTVLRFNAKVGEMMSSTGPQPVAVLGDMSAIQISAEIQERDVSKVRVGQGVVVRSNAFDGLEFIGKVTEVAPSVGSPGLRPQGPGHQVDAEVLEVKIELDGKPPVMPGMRVDVFFKNEQRVSAIIRKH
jgi:HlyD family secretion protein